jgi:hypothetical protein
LSLRQYDRNFIFLENRIEASIFLPGIIGNDGRHYILDLLRTFPPDVNFLEIADMELSKEARALGTQFRLF